MPPAPPKTKASASSKPKTTSRAPPKTAPQKPNPKKTSAAPKPARKRKAAEVEESDNDNDASSSVAAKAPILKARTRSIPQVVFNDRWGRLPEAAIEDIRALITSAERPAITSFRKDKQRIEAQRVITKLAAKLNSSLAKVPVPPLGKEYALNLEKILEKGKESEAVLQPTRKQVAELEKELEREIRAKERDERMLKELTRNAKAQEQVRAEKLKTLPAFMRKEPDPEKLEINDTLLPDPTLEDAAAYKVQNDREMLPLTEQLQQHLRSMETNAQLIAEIPEWMATVKDAVAEVMKEAEDTSLYHKALSLF